MKSLSSRCSQNNSTSSSFSQPWPPSPFPLTQIESQPSCHQFALQLSSIPHENFIEMKIASLKINISEGTTDSSFECFPQSSLNSKYIKVISQITNLHLNSASKTRLNLSFKVLTKLQLQNLNQASASKFWPNFSFKNQHSAPKSRSSFGILTKIEIQIFTKVQFQLSTKIQLQIVYQTSATTP